MRRARRVGVGVCLLFAAMGFMGLIPLWLDPSSARAPIWLVELSCSAFFVGISLVCETMGWRIAARLLSFSLIHILAITAFWALSDGGGTCSVSTGMLGFFQKQRLPTEDCTSMAPVFSGTVAVAIVIAAMVLALRWFRQSRRT